MEEMNPSFQDLNSPFEELFEFLVVAEDPFVHFFVFENPISVITNRVSFSVVALHIRDKALEFFIAQVFIEDAVGAELRAPLEAFLEHVEGIEDFEVTGTEELE